jgi:hypothetical protein
MRSIEQQLDAAMVEFEEQRRLLGQFQAQSSEVSTVVHSRDRVLTLSFDGQGDLVKAVVNSEKYRTMAPAEVAAMFMDTFTSGRGQALARMSEMFGGKEIAGGVSVGDLIGGKADLGGLLDAIVGSALDSLPGETLNESERRRLLGGA